MGKVLTPQQIADFERDGYVSLANPFSEAILDRLLDWASEVQSWPETPGRHMMYFESSLKSPGQRILQRVENLYPYHEGFRELFDSDALKGAVSDLFGEPAILFKDKINFKLPGGDGFKWHQDQQAGWWNYADIFITALVCIDPMTPENGPLQISAGHHRSGLIGNQWEPLTDGQMQGMAFETLPLQPGDMVFFDSFAPHGSGPNLTDFPRRVLYVTYNKISAGDQREPYYADKRKSFPPDCERDPNKEYKFRV
ncbi:phytanoyl-CoA dioxygenase family protein [Nitrospina gracilis]|uniref:phytanoyl-CoA dioxygenase family protein n=1 Tax=Nitrospina gracilis TaxID=35801 RepID=UPI001F308175|nr:phytanoyl-CoA dioxygenase family protein [Nitrospina gracilis]MCF8720728.1 ectoine hydroxylase-related dioxygenase (phytanoyl-CoA dioxygenase family) [Nitrospina gracilis Nb-211]